MGIRKKVKFKNIVFTFLIVVLVILGVNKISCINGNLDEWIGDYNYVAVFPRVEEDIKGLYFEKI